MYDHVCLVTAVMPHCLWSMHVAYVDAAYWCCVSSYWPLPLLFRSTRPFESFCQCDYRRVHSQCVCCCPVNPLSLLIIYHYHHCPAHSIPCVVCFMSVPLFPLIFCYCLLHRVHSNMCAALSDARMLILRFSCKKSSASVALQWTWRFSMRSRGP
jgi:hypothetical protein